MKLESRNFWGLIRPTPSIAICNNSLIDGLIPFLLLGVSRSRQRILGEHIATIDSRISSLVSVDLARPK